MWGVSRGAYSRARTRLARFIRSLEPRIVELKLAAVQPNRISFTARRLLSEVADRYPAVTDRME